MKIRVVSNAAIDLPEDLMEKYNIAKIPHVVFFDEKDWKLGIDISDEDFYELLKTEKIIPPTANPEPVDFQNAFEESFDKFNYDHVFCITAAQAMGSATYSAAKMAAKKFKEKITLIDTESATGVQGLIALNIAELAENGINVDEILRIIEDLKQDGWQLDVVLGQIPAWNIKSIEYTKKVGMVGLGIVPDIKYKRNDKATGAYICYITREGLNKRRWWKRQ